jgi:hypothetical protein
LLVIDGLGRVGVAIDFDHQHPRAPAGEVDDIAPNDHLPPEFGAVESVRAEEVPQFLLGRGLFGSKALGMLQQILISH